MEINPFEGANPVKVDKRLNALLSFMDEIKETVLDIGEPNTLREELQKKLRIKIFGTLGDLNFNEWIPQVTGKFSTVICSEVIEHLINPGMFLERLKLFCTKDCAIYIFYPLRLHFFWTFGSFHEYDRDRFRYLLMYCGYEVVKYKQEWRKRENWKYYFTGLRPLLLRWNVGRVRAQMYKLKIKEETCG
jgi:hypothetical protein